MLVLDTRTFIPVIEEFRDKEMIEAWLEFYKDLVQKVFQNIIIFTPVKTGLLQRRWTLIYGGRSVRTRPVTANSRDTVTQKADRDAVSQFVNISAKDAFKGVFIFNPVFYAEFVNNGTGRGPARHMLERGVAAGVLEAGR